MTAETMTGGQALARQLVREGVRRRVRPPRRPDHARARRALRRAVDPVHHHPARAGHHLPRRRLRPRRRSPGVGVRRARASASTTPARGSATAFAASSPVVLIAGQVNRDGIGRGLGLLHEIDDQLDLVRPITAWQRRALTAGEIPDAVHEAFARVQRGRRQPVEIEMPPEAFSEEGEVTLLDRADDVREAADPEQIAAPPPPSPPPSDHSIWAGGGVVLGDASAALAAVAEHLQAPVVTTRQGKGAIDDRHPLAAGSVWVNRRMQPLLDDADVVLAVGTHFLGNKLAAEKTVVHLDVDPDGDRPPLRRPARGRRRCRAHARAPARRPPAAARRRAQPGRRDPGLPQAGRRRPPRRRPPGPHGRPAPRRRFPTTGCSCRAPRRSGT